MRCWHCYVTGVSRSAKLTSLYPGAPLPHDSGMLWGSGPSSQPRLARRDARASPSRHGNKAAGRVSEPYGVFGQEARNGTHERKDSTDSARNETTQECPDRVSGEDSDRPGTTAGT